MNLKKKYYWGKTNIQLSQKFVHFTFKIKKKQFVCKYVQLRTPQDEVLASPGSDYVE